MDRYNSRRAGAKATVAVAVALAALFASGCSDSGKVVIHKPGEYLGPHDPLLDGDNAARAKTLRERFELVQAAR